MLTMKSLNGKILLDFCTEVLVSSESLFNCLEQESFQSCLVELHPAFQVSRLPDLQNVGLRLTPDASLSDLFLAVAVSKWKP